jgi:hypothetical protein
MLWGRYQYKHQLLAEPQILYRLIVYPSVTQMLIQPLIVLQILFHGCYVRSVQRLQNHLEKEKSPGWQWIYHRLRSLKKALDVFRKKFKWINAKNLVTATDFSLATSINEDKDRSTAVDFVSASRTEAIGTATRSCCPMQAL